MHIFPTYFLSRAMTLQIFNQVGEFSVTDIYRKLLTIVIQQ